MSSLDMSSKVQIPLITPLSNTGSKGQSPLTVSSLTSSVKKLSLRNKNAKSKQYNFDDTSVEEQQQILSKIKRSTKKKIPKGKKIKLNCVITDEDKDRIDDDEYISLNDICVCPNYFIISNDYGQTCEIKSCSNCEYSHIDTVIPFGWESVISLDEILYYFVDRKILSKSLPNIKNKNEVVECVREATFPYMVKMDKQRKMTFAKVDEMVIKHFANYKVILRI
jgi:hypothetical protein